MLLIGESWSVLLLGTPFSAPLEIAAVRAVRSVCLSSGDARVGVGVGVEGSQQELERQALQTAVAWGWGDSLCLQQW